MIGAKAWASQARQMGEFLDLLARAKEIDPDAYRATMVPHYSDQQLFRQKLAFDRAVSEAQTGKVAEGARLARIRAEHAP